MELEQIRLTFDDIAPQGDALAHHDGEVLFAPGGIPGEQAVVSARRTRRKFYIGEIVEVISPSPHRVEPRCRHFGRCSGCGWQHIAYPFQLELKRGAVARQLVERGQFGSPPVLPTLPSPEVWNYRNHARFTEDDGRLGFVNKTSRKFIPIDYCHIMHPWINERLESLQGRCAGANQVAMRYGVNTGSWLIQPKLKDIDIETGQPFYEEKLLDRRFRISSPSFFQVNTGQAERLFAVVRDSLRLSGSETVVDVFAGVGTFAVLLATSVARVIAIEESSAAKKDASVNMEGLSNIEFIQGKAEDELPRLSPAPDAAVLDPPRAGCQRRFLEALLRQAPRRIAYVSCDPFTLARDLRILCDGGYRLRSVRPVDMFPHTYHVECVASLVRSDVSPGVVLASASPRRSELLLALGLDFDVVPPPDDEMLPGDGRSPEQVAEQLALTKAQAVAESNRDKVVIAADTIVVHRGRALGKPRDAQEAQEMLSSLRGGQHMVITGMAVISGGKSHVSHVATGVTMRDYSDGEIAEYVASGDAMDKAGAYAVQHPQFRPAARVDGCYLNVVGLPLCELAQMLKEAGVKLEPRPAWALPPQCGECGEISIL